MNEIFSLSIPMIWLLFGMGAILLEFLVPGVIMVFFGTSAIVVGLLLHLGLPWTGGLPFLLFSVLTVGQIVFLRHYFKRWFSGNTFGEVVDGTEFEEFIGREAIVIRGFTDNELRGKVEFRGAPWTARATQALQIGQRVRIIDRDGMKLKVEPIT